MGTNTQGQQENGQQASQEAQEYDPVEGVPGSTDVDLSDLDEDGDGEIDISTASSDQIGEEAERIVRTFEYEAERVEQLGNRLAAVLEENMELKLDQEYSRIEQMRDSLAAARAENTRLKEENERLKAENAKPKINDTWKDEETGFQLTVVRDLKEQGAQTSIDDDVPNVDSLPSLNQLRAQPTQDQPSQPTDGQ